MKIKPTETLEAAICVTPLDVAVFGGTGFPANRLNCQGEWRNTRVKIYET
jgi:hypothetical protein